MKPEMKEVPLGRAYEQEVLGRTDSTSHYDPRIFVRRNLSKSLQLVIQYNWAVYAESVEKGREDYNPAQPKSGYTAQIFQAVKAHLPRRIRQSRVQSLHLYLAVDGVNLLDWGYGVDAFFTWQGAVVTLDVSLLPKDKMGTLKADVLLSPSDLQNLDAFGRRVAAILKERRRRLRENRKRERVRFDE